MTRGASPEVTKAQPSVGPGDAVVAIIMLSWNQREKSLRALVSLSDCGYSSMPTLLWDNGSDDGTVDAVRVTCPWVHVERCPRNLGVASGRNAAAEAASRRWPVTHLLFLDNDMVFTAGFVEKLLGAFDDRPDVAQAQARIMSLEEPDRIFSAGGTRISFARGTIRPVGSGETDLPPYLERKPCLPSGGGTMVTAAIFLALGGFDPVFDPYGPEDLDFSLRVAAAGYVGMYVPDAVIYHENKRTFDGGRYTPAFTASRTRHFLLLLKRHASVSDKALFAAWGLPTTFLRVWRRELRLGNSRVLTAMIRGFFRTIRN